MIKGDINKLIDRIMPASFDTRIWIGKIPKSFQLEYLGTDFGSAVIKLTENQEVVQILKKSRYGSIINKGVRFEVVAKYRLDKPMLSSFDAAPPVARKAIIGLMKEYKQLR